MRRWCERGNGPGYFEMEGVRRTLERSPPWGWLELPRAGKHDEGGTCTSKPQHKLQHRAPRTSSDHPPSPPRHPSRIFPPPWCVQLQRLPLAPSCTDPPFAVRPELRGHSDAARRKLARPAGPCQQHRAHSNTQAEREAQKIVQKGQPRTPQPIWEAS